MDTILLDELIVELSNVGTLCQCTGLCNIVARPCATYCTQYLRPSGGPGGRAATRCWASREAPTCQGCPAGWPASGVPAAARAGGPSFSMYAIGMLSDSGCSVAAGAQQCRVPVLAHLARIVQGEAVNVKRLAMSHCKHEWAPSAAQAALRLGGRPGSRQVLPGSVLAW